MFGLFATKGRQKIYEKQIDVVSNLDSTLKNCFSEDFTEKDNFVDLIKRLLDSNYVTRISPTQILEHNFLKN